MSFLEYLLAVTALRVVLVACRLLPVQRDKVVLASARAEKLEGNLAFVHDALRAKCPDARIVLLLERYSYGLLGKFAYMGRLLRGAYHVATARLVVLDNAYLPVHAMPHRAATVVVQVWHAAGALKKFGLDTKAPERRVENRFVHRYYDRVIVGSRAAIGPYSSALRTPVDKVVPLGVPRTDLFFDRAANSRAITRVQEAHPVLKGRRVVLFAPTFRGHGIGKSAADGLDVLRLKETLGDAFAFAYKPHPVLEPTADEVRGYDAVIDGSIDLNEVLCATDILITDYSSSVFEWALLRKPLVLFVPDLDRYERDPGFYLDYRTEMIGVMAGSGDEVERLLRSDSWDLSGYDRFVSTHCEFDDGHASERFAEWADSILRA
jgi:CDP-ribitol ribitolphosphotransferase